MFARGMAAYGRRTPVLPRDDALTTTVILQLPVSVPSLRTRFCDRDPEMIEFVFSQELVTLIKC
jgi:hypothetical protein